MMVASNPGQTLMIGQFGAQIRSEFALTNGQYGMLYTVATLASAMLLVWAGALSDRFSPRRMALASIAGLAMVAVGMSGVSSVPGLVVLLFGLRFFGQGMMMLIAVTMISRWFNRFRGRALAMSQLGTSTGTAILPFAITLGIVAIGWRQVWLITALILVVAVAPVIFFLLRRPPDGQHARRNGITNPDAAPTEFETGDYWTRVRVLRDPLFYFGLLAMITPAAIGTAIIFHQSHLIAVKGWNLLVFAGSFPVLTATEMVTALVVGYLVDRFGAWRLLPAMLVPLALASLALWLGHGLAAIPLLFFFLGMSSGTTPPILGALWPELYGTKRIGAIRALVTSAMVLASALGPGIAGLLIDAGIALPNQGLAFAAFCLSISVLYLVFGGRFADRAARAGAAPDA